MRLGNIKMKPKIILLFLIVGIIPLLFLGLWSGRQAKEALMTKSYSQLVAVREIKKVQIENFFAARKTDMNVLVKTVQSLRDAAFEKLKSIQELKKSRLEDYFDTMQKQLNILEHDPFIRSALLEFDISFEASRGNVLTPEWDEVAKRYDSRMRNIMEVNGWYDM